MSAPDNSMHTPIYTIQDVLTLSAICIDSSAFCMPRAKKPYATSLCACQLAPGECWALQGVLVRVHVMSHLRWRLLGAQLCDQLVDRGRADIVGPAVVRAAALCVHAQVPLQALQKTAHCFARCKGTQSGRQCVQAAHLILVQDLVRDLRRYGRLWHVRMLLQSAQGHASKYAAAMPPPASKSPISMRIMRTSMLMILVFLHINPCSSL